MQFAGAVLQEEHPKAVSAVKLEDHRCVDTGSAAVQTLVCRRLPNVNIFISWSGEPSNRAAEYLESWLPQIVQSARPFVSGSDIDKGTRWGTELRNHLEASDFGIVCLTPQNLNSAWILFEAGALSKLDNSRVCPILFGLKPANVTFPLAQFQLTMPDRQDIKKLVFSMNQALPDDRRISNQVLERSFEKFWPELEEQLNGVIEETKLLESDRPASSSGGERQDRELLEELLELARSQGQDIDALLKQNALNNSLRYGFEVGATGPTGVRLVPQLLSTGGSVSPISYSLGPSGPTGPTSAGANTQTPTFPPSASETEPSESN